MPLAADAEPPDDATFRAHYGPWALVTGAAQGIGRAFAEGLARRGLSLHLLDLQGAAVTRVAHEVAERFGVATRPLVADLSEPHFMQAVDTATRDTEVGLLVCNAAFGQAGPFFDETADALARAVAVNCTAPLLMTHHFAHRMVGRRRGGILLLASGTALQGSPGFASYAATKAFNLVLGESLWHELSEHGVDTLAFVPGPTNTPGLRSSVPGLREGQERGPIKLPEATAEAALQMLGRAPTAARQPEHAQVLAERQRATEAQLAKTRR